MKKLILLSSALLLTACSGQTKVSKADEVLFTINGKTTTKAQVYEKLTANISTDTVDHLLFSKIALAQYGDKEEVKEDAKKTLEEVKTSLNDTEKFNKFLLSIGMASEEDAVNKVLLAESALKFLKTDYLKTEYLPKHVYGKILFKEYSSQEEAEKALKALEAEEKNLISKNTSEKDIEVAIAKTLNGTATTSAKIVKLADGIVPEELLVESTKVEKPGLLKRTFKSAIDEKYYLAYSAYQKDAFETEIINYELSKNSFISELKDKLYKDYMPLVAHDQNFKKAVDSFNEAVK